MKPKPLWGALTRAFENMEPPDIEPVGAGYRQHTDVEDGEDAAEQGRPPWGGSWKDGDKGSKEVHFAFLPDRYEPLVEEDEARERAKEEKKLRKKEKCKKYRKNVGKALRFSWKCLLVGLQSLTASYSTATVATLIQELHKTRPRG